MEKIDSIFIAGARGLVGSAIVRHLKKLGYQNLLTPSSKELDLTNQSKTLEYFQTKKPMYVIDAAAKVGGIMANSTYMADFCQINLQIQLNLIHSAYLTKVKKLMFLGSSCIYPVNAEIPIKETSLLTGPLEPTNEGYAIAKIAGVKLCDYYRKQYGCDFISVMPTNIYGPYDNFDLQNSHMVPGLIHKFHIGKTTNSKSVNVWGTGKPMRELLYSEDLAEAVIYLMQNFSDYGPINVGTGEDFTVSDVANRIKSTVEFNGEITFDTSKPDGMFRKVMDVSRINSMGWRARTSLDDGLDRSYQWFLDNFDQLKK